MAEDPTSAPQDRALKLGGRPRCNYPIKGHARRGIPGGTPCKKPCEPGRDRCRLHWGRNPVGAANGNYRNGTYSKYELAIPEELREAHRRMLADPQAAQLVEEKALAALLLSEQIKRTGSGAAVAAIGASLLEAREIVGELQAAADAGDLEAAVPILARLEAALEAGATAEQRRQAAVRAEAQASRTLDLSRRLVDTQTKIAMRARAVLTLEELQMLVVRYADMVQEALHRLAIAIKAQMAQARAAVEALSCSLGPYRPGSDEAMIYAAGFEAARSAALAAMVAPEVAEAEERKAVSGFLVDVKRMAPAMTPGEVAN